MLKTCLRTKTPYKPQTEIVSQKANHLLIGSVRSQMYFFFVIHFSIRTDKTFKADLVQWEFFSPSMLLGAILAGRVYFSAILYSCTASSSLSLGL